MFDVPKPEAYVDQLERKHASQAGMSRDQIKEELGKTSEAVIDAEELVERGRAIQHNWVERGLKVSCEGAGHPTHAVFKRL